MNITQREKELVKRLVRGHANAIDWLELKQSLIKHQPKGTNQ